MSGADANCKYCQKSEDECNEILDRSGKGCCDKCLRTSEWRKKKTVKFRAACDECDTYFDGVAGEVMELIDVHICPRPKPDFWTETLTIRRWMESKDVDTSKLISELHRWADYMESGIWFGSEEE